jgi:hypothetical protein
MACGISPFMGTDFSLSFTTPNTDSGGLAGGFLPLMLATATGQQQPGQAQQTTYKKDSVTSDCH